MNKETIITGMIIEETTTFSFIEVCHRYHIPKELLIEMVEQGLFPTQSADIEDMTLDQKSIHRIESAFRLHKDLGINLAGVALALDLLDELDNIRAELRILKRHV